MNGLKKGFVQTLIKITMKCYFSSKIRGKWGKVQHQKQHWYMYLGLIIFLHFLYFFSVFPLGQSYRNFRIRFQRSFKSRIFVQNFSFLGVTGPSCGWNAMFGLHISSVIILLCIICKLVYVKVLTAVKVTFLCVFINCFYYFNKHWYKVFLYN